MSNIECHLTNSCNYPQLYISTFFVVLCFSYSTTHSVCYCFGPTNRPNSLVVCSARIITESSILFGTRNAISWLGLSHNNFLDTRTIHGPMQAQLCALGLQRYTEAASFQSIPSFTFWVCYILVDLAVSFSMHTFASLNSSRKTIAISSFPIESRTSVIFFQDAVYSFFCESWWANLVAILRNPFVFVWAFFEAIQSYKLLVCTLIGQAANTSEVVMFPAKT